MNENFDNRIDCMPNVRHSLLFAHLSASELERVNKTIVTVTFKKGETIRKQGAYLTHLIYLNDGLAKVYLEGNNLKNIVIAIMGPHKLIAGPGMFIDQKHHYSVSALTEASVSFVEIDLFKRLLLENCHFAVEYFEHISKMTLSAYRTIIKLTQKPMKSRLADALLFLSDESSNKKGIFLELSNKDIADLSGVSRDNVVRLLKQFRQEKLINNNGSEIELLNINSLKGISNNY